MDNRNIFSQIRYLANVYMQIPENRYAECAKRGILWILNAQEPNTGGFTGADVFAITFNDDVMADVLSFLNEVVQNRKLYAFVDEETCARAQNAYSRGIECILKTQIKVTLDDGSKFLRLGVSSTVTKIMLLSGRGNLNRLQSVQLNLKTWLNF